MIYIRCQERNREEEPTTHEIRCVKNLVPAHQDVELQVRLRECRHVWVLTRNRYTVISWL
jgi:hypothetical protein